MSKPAGSYHHGDLKRELLRAASALLDEAGADKLSLRELAKRANVSPGAPYRHFESRDALLATLAEEGFEELEREMVEASGRHGATPRDELEALASAYLGIALRRPHRFRMMFSADLGPSRVDEGIFRACDRVYRRLLEAFSRGQLSGAFKKSEPDRQTLLFWSTLHGFAMLLVDHRLDDFQLDEPGKIALLKQMLTELFGGLAR